MLAKYQNVIIIVVVLAIAFGVYSYFFVGKEEAVLTSENTGAAAPADQDLIALLLDLKSISLDEQIFSDPAFQSLSDFSQDLVAEPVGRDNPFAPLGAGAQSGAKAP
jgi:hypothetical protein